MKKLIYTTLITLLASVTFSQSNITIHHGRVIGSFELGTKEVTTVIDEATGCVIRTTPHAKGLFIPNEPLELEFKKNNQMAEIKKESLTEKVYIKKCTNNFTPCSSPLCILKNDGNNLLLKYTNNNHKVFYHASIKKNNSIKSNLIIYSGSKSIPTSFFLDKSNPTQYRLYSHKSVNKEAEKLLKKGNLQLSSSDILLLENMVLDIKVYEQGLTQSELTKSIFYHIAIFKSAKRALDKNNDTCNCTPVPFYFTDKSPFLCQEDLEYNISNLLLTLDANSKEIEALYSEETINELKMYLNKKALEKNIIEFGEFNSGLPNGLSTEEFLSNIDDHVGLGGCWEGSSLGCCGNYSGCCWVWSLGCLAHDLACLNCDHWHCGWGCQSL